MAASGYEGVTWRDWLVISLGALFLSMVFLEDYYPGWRTFASYTQASCAALMLGIVLSGLFRRLKGGG